MGTPSLRPTLWHRFTEWMMHDFYTLEERELIREETRRLKMANDLFEERQARRRARRRERRERETRANIVALWRVTLRFTDERGSDVGHAMVPLRQSKTHREIGWGEVQVAVPGRSAVALSTEGKSVCMTKPEWGLFVLPWFNDDLPTEKLFTHPNIFRPGELIDG